MNEKYLTYNLPFNALEISVINEMIKHGARIVTCSERRITIVRYGKTD